MKHQTNGFRNQAGKFTQTQTEKNTMNGFLRQTTISHIDEKVAILRGYSLQKQDCKNIEDGVRTRSDGVVADIKAMVSVVKYIGGPKNKTERGN